MNVLKVKGVKNDFNLKTISPNADEQVQDASVHWRGGRSEDTHGEQLQASAAPQRQKSVLLQLMYPSENPLHELKKGLFKAKVNGLIRVYFLRRCGI